MSFFLSSLWLVVPCMNRKKILKWTRILLIVYITGGVALYFLQDYILFHPVTLKRDHRFDFPEPHRDISIPMNEKDTLNVVDFASTGDSTKGIVLYFHGNKKNIYWYHKFMPYFTRHGYEVMIIDYPGYGKSTGKLTEKKLYDWALQTYKLANKRFPAEKIIIYGKSMGTGIAAELASVRDCKRLILETPYYDFPAVVKHYLPIYPVRWMLHYDLPTWQYLQQIKRPISIFHGTKDRIVVYDNTIRLKEYLKPGDEVTTIRGGHHNDLFTYKEVINKLDSLLELP